MAVETQDQIQSPTGGSLLGLSQKMQSATNWIFKRPPKASTPQSNIPTPNLPETASSSELQTPSPPLPHSSSLGSLEAVASEARKPGSPEGDSGVKGFTRCLSSSADSDVSSPLDMIRCISCDSAKSASSAVSSRSEASDASSDPIVEQLCYKGISVAEDELETAEEEVDPTTCVPIPLSFSPSTDGGSGGGVPGEWPSDEAVASVGVLSDTTDAKGGVRESALEAGDQKLRDEIGLRLERYQSAHADFQRSVVKLMSAQECLQAAGEKFKARVEIATRLASVKA